MARDNPPVIANLILPLLIKPALNKIELQSHETALDIKLALLKAESAYPGLILEMITKFTQHVDPDIDITKSLLLIQSTITEDTQTELSKRSNALKRTLGRIPNEITDRKVFLETIKEVASSIKKLLDCLTDIINRTESETLRLKLDDRKRDFIRSSKRFSNKLKEFFKEGETQPVYNSAAHLINQIYAIELSIRRH